MLMKCFNFTCWKKLLLSKVALTSIFCTSKYISLLYFYFKKYICDRSIVFILSPNQNVYIKPYIIIIFNTLECVHPFYLKVLKVFILLEYICKILSNKSSSNTGKMKEIITPRIMELIFCPLHKESDKHLLFVFSFCLEISIYLFHGFVLL